MSPSQDKSPKERALGAGHAGRHGIKSDS